MMNEAIKLEVQGPVNYWNLEYFYNCQKKKNSRPFWILICSLQGDHGVVYDGGEPTATVKWIDLKQVFPIFHVLLHTVNQ